MSPAAKGRRAPSGSCVVAEGGPNSIRAEISRSHGTAPLVPMTPASAKPETGRPGGGYAPVGVGPTPLPRWQAPGGAAVSVLVCARALIFGGRPLHRIPHTFTHWGWLERAQDVPCGTRLAAQRNVGGRDAPLRDRPRHRHQVWACCRSALPAGGRTAGRGGGRARAGDARFHCRARRRARLHRHVRAACSPAQSPNARPGTVPNSSATSSPTTPGGSGLPHHGEKPGHWMSGLCLGPLNPKSPFQRSYASTATASIQPATRVFV